MRHRIRPRTDVPTRHLSTRHGRRTSSTAPCPTPYSRPWLLGTRAPWAFGVRVGGILHRRRLLERPHAVAQAHDDHRAAPALRWLAVGGRQDQPALNAVARGNEATMFWDILASENAGSAFRSPVRATVILRARLRVSSVPRTVDLSRLQIPDAPPPQRVTRTQPSGKIVHYRVAEESMACATVRSSQRLMVWRSGSRAVERVRGSTSVMAGLSVRMKRWPVTSARWKANSLWCSTTTEGAVLLRLQHPRAMTLRTSPTGTSSALHSSIRDGIIRFKYTRRRKVRPLAAERTC